MRSRYGGIKDRCTINLTAVKLMPIIKYHDNAC